MYSSMILLEASQVSEGDQETRLQAIPFFPELLFQERPRGLARLQMIWSFIAKWFSEGAKLFLNLKGIC